MEPTARIRLCGRLEVEWEGERLEPALPGNQGRLLFAYLILHRGRPVRRDELLAVLWPGEGAPDGADALLSSPLSRLRKALGPGRLEGRAELSLQLPSATSIDYEMAFGGLREAHSAVDADRWRDGLTAAQAALAIADRGLLPGLEADWIDARRADLADLRLELLEIVATCGLKLGELREAEQAARAAVEAAPFRESARAALIEVLQKRGNVADALRAFEEVRTLLREELGAAPGPLLARLHEQLLRPERTAPQVALPDRLAAALATPLVGREAALARLQTELRRARAGETPVLLVTGEGGIGKTRLIAELARAADGFTVLYGRCDEDQLFPFGPWIELLGSALTRVSDADLPALLGDEGPELTRLLPELRSRVPGLPGPAASTPENELRHLYTAVVALVRRLARQRPVLAIIDDLHWADRSSLLLSRHLVRTLGVGPALLLGAYRDTELGDDHPLPEVLADLERDRPLPRIALRGLDVAEVAALAGVNADVARSLRDETDGNPFFVKQLARHRDEAGTATGLRDVIVRRVGRLPGEAPRVLKVAALIGRDFDLRLLERVVDVPEDDLLDLLDAAVTAGILVEVPSAPGRYSFVHALVRTTLEGELSATRCARLHRRIGDALETLHGERPDPWLVELARHFTAAGPEEGERAIAYSTRAAAQATERLAHGEAAALLAAALAASDPADERADLLHDLAQARWRQGRPHAARDTFARAAEAARRAGAADVFARAALGYAAGGWEHFGTEDEASTHLLEQALALLPETDSPLRAQVLARLGGVLYWSAARRTSLIDDAVAMARRLGDDLALATALSAAQFVYWRIGTVVTRLPLAEELVAVAERIGNAELEAEAVTWRVSANLALRRLAPVEADIARHAELVRRLEHPEHSTHAAGFRAMRALLVGDWAQGELAAADILRAGEDAVRILAWQEHGAAMMEMRGEQLRLGESAEQFEKTSAALPGMPAWRTSVAWAWAQAGRRDEARAELAALRRDDFAVFPRDVNFDLALAVLVQVADELGDVETAAAVEPHLRPLADRWMVFGIGVGTLGPAAYSLGVCNLLTGNLDAAIADFELALEHCRAMGARPYEAHASLRAARALTLRGDHERAAAFESTALEIARELGMPRLLRDAAR